MKKVLFYSLIPIYAALFYLAGKAYFFGFFVGPVGDTLFVKANSGKIIENGSRQYPFTRIEPALERAKHDEEVRVISITPGEYQGKIRLRPGLKLIAERPGVKIKYPYQDFTRYEHSRFMNYDDSAGAVVVMQQDNYLYGLELFNGYFGALIEESGGSRIEDTFIRDNRKYGILNLEQEQPEPAKSNIIYKATVAQSGKQGMYLQKSLMKVLNCKVYYNAEEGIDLHEGMTVIIKNCSVNDNGESGIEADLGNNEIYIENCTVKGNQKQGVTLQSSEENTSVVLRNNVIQYNHHYGLRCVVHSKTEKAYFSRALVDGLDYVLGNNQIQYNGVEEGVKNVASKCKK
ncbi:MAG: hypothetical protein GF332_00515 [Candidatus Moranbacteria bacterium]|nr:hypothetical protein [Candidatus Moranbacteria bacterium]